MSIKSLKLNEIHLPSLNMIKTSIIICFKCACILPWVVKKHQMTRIMTCILPWVVWTANFMMFNCDNDEQGLKIIWPILNCLIVYLTQIKQIDLRSKR